MPWGYICALGYRIEPPLCSSTGLSVLWIMIQDFLKAALKDFETFPEGAQSILLAALTIAAEGGKADIAKPMHGMGSGVLELALRIGSSSCLMAAASPGHAPLHAIRPRF
jgi:hypothetical protein